MRAAQVAGLGVLGLLMLAVGCSDGRGSDGAVQERSTTTAATEDLGLPVPSETARHAAAEYLAGGGNALLELHDAALEAAGGLDAAGCRGLVARLDAEVPADVVADLTAGVPEEVLRGAFYAERTALGVALTTCLTESELPLEQLRRAVTVVEARLGELGVR